MLERLGAEVDQTIDELRAVAGGLYPQVLAQAGVGPALAAVGPPLGEPRQACGTPGSAAMMR